MILETTNYRAFALPKPVRACDVHRFNRNTYHVTRRSDFRHASTLAQSTNNNSCPRHALARGFQRLIDIREDVINVLNAHGQADHVPAHAGRGELAVIELTVRRRRRVASQ